MLKVRCGEKRQNVEQQDKYVEEQPQNVDGKKINNQ